MSSPNTALWVMACLLFLMVDLCGGPSRANLDKRLTVAEQAVKRCEARR